MDSPEVLSSLLLVKQDKYPYGLKAFLFICLVVYSIFAPQSILTDN
jgi:hypothetical protein